VQVSGATHKGHDMIIHVEITVPGPNCLELAVVTYPYTIVTIPSTRFIIVFDTNTIATNCM
jgi:protease stability complex PrcB-like protein